MRGSRFPSTPTRASARFFRLMTGRVLDLMSRRSVKCLAPRPRHLTAVWALTLTAAPPFRVAALAVFALFALLWPLGVEATIGGNPSDEYAIRIARVKYGGGGDWYSDPSSIPNWLREFQVRTGIKTHPEEKVVSIMDEDLRAYPFLYMTGHGTVRLAPEEIETLRAYLEAGGFLYADDCYGMDDSFRKLVRELFPEKELEELPNAHPIYHTFYDLPGLPKIHEHDGKPPQGFGITIDGRLALFYTYETDIGDGLEDARVHNDPPEKRELAVRMAVNILAYAITQNALP